MRIVLQGIPALAAGIIGAAVLPLGGWAQAGETPLVNPGFEEEFKPVSPKSDSDNKNADIQGNVAPGWGDNSNWADVSLRYSKETKDTHGGNAAQRIKVLGVRSGAVQFVASPVAFKKGNVYQFRVWLKGENGTNVELVLRQAGAPYATYAARSYQMGGGWRECEVTALVPEDTQGFLMMRLTAPGEFVADDAVLDNLTTKVSDAPAKIGNLLPNASFEAGTAKNNTIWATGGWTARFESIGSAQAASAFAYKDPRPRRDTQTPAAVGKASLRLDIPQSAAATVKSPSIKFNYGKPHTVSFWARAERPAGIDATLQGVNLGKTFPLTAQWQRYTVTGTPTYRASTFLTLRVDAPDAPNKVWVDGVQVEESGTVSAEYKPSTPRELALGSDRAGHVYFDKEPVTIWARVSGSAAPAKLQLEYEDAVGKVRRWTNLVPVPPAVTGSEVRFAVPPMNPAKPRGMYKLRAVLVDAKGNALSAPAECVYAVLPTPRTIQPEDSYFGIHIPLTPDYIALSLATGHRWARLHDSSMVGKWAGVELEKGKWVWADDGVIAATNAGMRILGMLDGAPAWTTTQPREGYWGFWNIPDKPGAIDDWANYVRTITTHYKGRIDHWEIWNEPWGRWWIGSGNPNATPELYGELMKRAYTEARQANSKVTIVGVDAYRSLEEGIQWTPKVLAAAPPTHFDAFSFHLYDGTFFGGPNPNARVDADYFNKAQKNAGGPVRPLWNTEGGPGDIGSMYARDASGLPPALQVTQAVRYDVTMMASGVKHFFLYAIHNDPQWEDTAYQAIEYDRAIRPILAGRAVLASLIDGAKSLGRTEPVPGVDAYTFSDAVNKRRVTVVWSYDSAKHMVSVPKGTRVLDMWGNPLAATGGKVMVGNEPIYWIR